MYSRMASAAAAALHNPNENPARYSAQRGWKTLQQPNTPPQSTAAQRQAQNAGSSQAGVRACELRLDRPPAELRSE